jgi:hypothetical protein
MKSRFVSIAMLTAIVAAPMAANAARITVWPDYDFRGSSTVFEGAQPRLEGGWNDRISSLRVDSGTWEICRDWDYANCRIVGPGSTEITRMDSGWNDTISSLRPVSETSSVDPQRVAERLYRALLGREADPDGLRNATSQVAAGRVNDVVNSITRSDEFRNVRQQRSSSEMLDQIYRGLLGRSADTAARTAYQRRIENGDFSGVVADLIASEEFGSAGSTAIASNSGTATGDDNRTRGRSTGTVVRGPRNATESINSVKVLLGGDGRYRLTFNGSQPHQIEGTYTREGSDFARINTIEVNGASLPARGGITLNQDFLERLDVEAGTPGTRDYVAYNFAVDAFQSSNMSNDSAACQQAVRARIQQQRGAHTKVAFVGQEMHSRSEVRGTVVILADNTRAQYRCQIDRRGQVTLASMQ